MAPSATYPITSTHSGADLEAISDAVDEINVLKFKAAQQVTELLDSDCYSSSSPTSTAATSPSATHHDQAQDHEDLGDFDTPSHFDSTKDHSRFRQYTTAESRVLNFYAEQHAKQTVSHNVAARARFNSPDRKRPEMTIWEAIECLNSLIDESDPDTELSQIQHLLQSAEAIRRDGKPRWMQLVGLVHDLGKLMLFFELATGQWDVVGDSFPVGCRFSEKCILPESFAVNPDSTHPVYSTEHGIYAPGCGIENLMMSWGHDEYLYQVLKDQSLLPREGLAMIRFHSFYPWHREEAYGWAMKEGDGELRRAVRAFNPYDLYSKSDEPVDVEAVKPYYTELINEFFPQKVIKW
ncbi:hypothetical protein SMACR_07955 [Sordaria macrospora]|uniref:Inositol oxygenase n=2 Tax=Sordaria macrospora TaxID=5147 RepID=F7W905_SORMK|nr:uncharacterized protein SMAC_07955 [Sordaria macrospora k-hell]KAA8631963.1 hypothetical protein SMACR_07955 [Sordaria macrospora]KAH7632364.1 hypothetical protein B0T09DRAFT_72930 [Sordaria sp. MPI-SDFR-AT-0083]WPJ61136.1 hypothetical protein SMAC4_07955 [Sordaria macrospora]CCC13886.1 unnamed protein product [Sordaria macrospora k-hell]